MKYIPPPTPTSSYGVLLKDDFVTEFDQIAEQVKRLGYAVLDSGYSALELEKLSTVFDLTRANYIRVYSEEKLRSINEFHTVRAPLAHGDTIFMRLAINPNLMTVLRKLIVGKFILNQQNGVINPPNETYNQGAWHRDLPYQHFVSNTPLAINALFCVDDFTTENGSTFVLPATHKSVNYPSEGYIKKNALQLEARAGQYILLDCMLFHAGGFNRSKQERRAINHVYSIPYFKQQIKLPELMRHAELDESLKELLGFDVEEPISIKEYLNGRVR